MASVAVSTRNRADAIRRLLRALERQTVPVDRFEVVIVDDASTDATPEVLGAEMETSPLRLRVIRSENNRGAAAGRNAAWRACTADVIAFTDDDCAPTPGWLEAGLDTIGRRDGVIVGATQPDPSQRHLLNPLARTLEVDEATFAPTANVFYLRRDLEATGGFDEGFGLLGGEDTDLAWRTGTSIGRDLVFAPDALVYHDIRPRSLSEAIRETRRWAGLALVASRYPDIARRAWHRGYFMRGSHPWVLVGLIGIAGAVVFPPALLLTLPWLRHRVFHGKPHPGWIRWVRWAPAMFALDAAEVFVLARASIRYRGLLL